MSPTIAVLIPTKNRRDLLERAIRSVQVQTVRPEEIIVVNDGSTDSTKEWLESLRVDGLKVINREQSGGVNTARNQGIKGAQSEWIAFLDDDDEFVPEAIEVMKRKIAELPEDYDVAYFNTKIFREGETFVGGFQFDKLEEHKDFYDPNYEETMTKFNLRGDCKQVMKKSVLLESKYKFPETVNGFESYTMNLLARDGKGIRYFPDVLTHIHQEKALADRLSIIAPRKSPWPMFLLHDKQLFQHWRFYFKHPGEAVKKKMTMFKLLLRTFS
jgi:glycosyltransferase involved in cell wall biosynthesis